MKGNHICLNEHFDRAKRNLVPAWKTKQNVQECIGKSSMGEPSEGVPDFAQTWEGGLE